MLESSDTQVLGMFGKEGCALWEQLWAQGLVQRQFSSTYQGREVGSCFLSQFFRLKPTTIHSSLRQAAMIFFKRNPTVLTFIFNYQTWCLIVLFLDLSERVTIVYYHRWFEGWRLIGRKKKKKNWMVRIGEQGTSYPPQMVNQTQLITSMLEVCWVVYWLIATLLVMTLQTAAQVHFICKNSGFSTPPRTSRDSFNKPKQRIKKWTPTHSTLLRWQALKEQGNHCEMWSRVPTERCSRKQLHRRWDVWFREARCRGVN